MIIYKVENNTVKATFKNGWRNSVYRFYKHNIKAYPTEKLLHAVYVKLDYLNASGMKFYGEAKCSPEDIFNENTGKILAKKRLLAKYNRVLSMLDEELLKVLQDDIGFINRHKAEHKERGQHR